MYRFAYVPQLYNKQQHYILTTPVYAISRSILTLNNKKNSSLCSICLEYNYITHRFKKANISSMHVVTVCFSGFTRFVSISVGTPT